MSPHPEDYSFGYTYAGGSPPASQEVFLVRADGAAQYVAGHSWPKQPPFDEIGVYRRKLADGEWDELSRRIELAHQNRSQFVEPRYADTGVESLFAWSGHELWRVSWDPEALSGAPGALITQVRKLIADLRQHPLSTLQVALEAENTELRLRLSNRGTLPFVFYGFGNASLDKGAELRLQFCDPEELKLSTSRSPIQLVRQPPLAGRYLAEAVNDEMHVEPGQSLVVTVTHRDAIIQRQPGALYALIHLFWKIGGFEAEEAVEEGWLMPQPLLVSGE